MNSKMNIKSILTLTILAFICLMFLNMSLAANTAKVRVKTANLRESASSDASIIVQLPENEEVEVLENSGEWCKVKHNDAEGYLKTELLNISETEEKDEEKTEAQNNEDQQEKAEKQNSDNKEENAQLGKYYLLENVKIKLIPLINAKELVEIEGGQEVEVTKIINNWAYINVQKENKTAQGWIRLEKIKSQDKKNEEEAQKIAEQEAAQAEADKTAQAIKTSYTQTKVNLRKEPNTNSEILQKLEQNTQIDVLAEDGEWSKCRINDVVGYISTQYLGSNKAEEEATSRGKTKARTAKEVDNSSKETATKEIVPPASSNGEAVVEYARQFIGKPYKYGGSGPDSFDCSGFTSYIYRQFGINLPHSSGAQASFGVAVDKSQLAIGDLVVYSGHVAIYVGGGNVIHAPRPGKTVSITSINRAAGNYKCARRLL